MNRFRQRLIDPFVMPVIFIAMIWLILMGIGKVFLNVTSEGDVHRIDRPELWVGTGIVVVVIGVMAFISSRPRGTTGILEKPVAIGTRPFFEEPLPPVDPKATTGAPGSVSDITEGYTLYAQSGALAVVRGVLPGGVDYGKRFAGFLYAEGLSGASKELWIPIEAVTTVYPESRSAFLAIKGDETEHFGWNIPPETVRRGPGRVPETHVKEHG